MFQFYYLQSCQDVREFSLKGTVHTQTRTQSSSPPPDDIKSSSPPPDDIKSSSPPPDDRKSSSPPPDDIKSSSPPPEVAGDLI